MPEDEWEAYEEEASEPDEPDMWRDVCDDPAREDFGCSR